MISARPDRAGTARSTLTLAGVLAGVFLGQTVAKATAPPEVPLRIGLVFTVTSHTATISNLGGAPVADTEIVYSVSDSTPEQIALQLLFGASSSEATNRLLAKAARTYARRIRRQDLEAATRERILFSSTEEELIPGQTYAFGSAAVLKALNGTGQVPFVLGINEPEGGLAALSGMGAATGGALTKSGEPLIGSGIAMLLGGGSRHYYRGTLQRVGRGDEPFPVLLNGVRTSVPAVHVKGEMHFSDQTITPELWWLDAPGNPLTLKWAVGGAYEVVTRIDWPPDRSGEGEQNRLRGGLTTQLAGKSCRAELAGVYFPTGSAEVLGPSMPALQQFAAVLLQHPDWQVTIEGHTDNIGSAEYNLNLSTRRADAVRELMVSRFKVPASHLTARGFGLTRPVDTNATDLGRAHNRRVEVSRRCG